MTGSPLKRAIPTTSQSTISEGRRRRRIVALSASVAAAVIHQEYDRRTPQDV